jgi:hypothetical protein
MSDLAAYYLAAPGFLGGGLEKAAQLASQIAALDAVAGHSVQARIAEKRQDFSGAEVHLQQAAAMAPRQIDPLLDLARFLARRGKVQKSEQVLATAAEVAPESPRLLFARAEIIQWRNLKEAQVLLRRYLQMPLTPEDPRGGRAEQLWLRLGLGVRGGAHGRVPLLKASSRRSTPGSLGDMEETNHRSGLGS